ncbi:MAG TPA: hypothetical protein VH855_14795 [Acetobacteraceae bacterium]
MSNREWLAIAVACGAAIGGLLLAASNAQGPAYCAGFALFFAAIICSALVIKRYFDRAERQSG